MKKSCSGKESKVVTAKEFEKVSNDSKEESLTGEQILINKKLSESGIDDQGLGWLEKRNIFKTINVSLSSGGNDKSYKSSPRLAKTNLAKSNYVESNSESLKKGDEKSFKVKLNKIDSESAETSTDLTSNVSSNKQNQENIEGSTKLDNKKIEFQGDTEINGDFPKSKKKIHYVKIHVEESPKEPCSTACESFNTEEENQKLNTSKKRTSPPEIHTIDTAKKLKMEDINNVVPLKDENPLRIEIEFERTRENTPFKLRDIKSIVSECEFRNTRWKETFSKYNCPARWGIPSVRNCNEKWDGKQIPLKLLRRYQKYLTSNNLFHPIFLPKLQSNSDFNKLTSEISSQSNTNIECKNESENDFKDSSENSFIGDEPKKIPVENNLNASTSDTSGRMVLRNRSQQKPVIVNDKLDEENYSSDDSGEWFSNQKSNKKQIVNSKNKRSTTQNKQLVLKLENCSINKKIGDEEERKNGRENTTGGLSLGNDSSKFGPDPDTMVCPICSLRFKKQLIESHATECASKTYKD